MLKFNSSTKAKLNEFWFRVRSKLYLLVAPSKYITDEKAAYRATMVSTLILLYIFLTIVSFVWSTYTMPQVTAKIEYSFYIAIILKGIFYLLSRTRYSYYVSLSWVIFMIFILMYSASFVLTETQAVQLLVHIANAIFVSSFIFSTFSTILISLVCITIISFSPEIYPVISYQSGDSLMRFLMFISALSTISGYLTDHFFELSRKNAYADATNESKTLFLASMSHEIRTPLTAIIGFSELAQSQRNLPKKTQLYLNKIFENSNYLLQLISNVIELSKIEAKQLFVQEVKVNMVNEIESAVSSFVKKAEEKDLKLNFNVSKTFPKYLLADSVKVRQILNNLIDNAIKYTEKGEIEINLSIRQDIKAGVKKVYIEVVDQGYGISLENQDTIFEFFQQGHSLITNAQGGAGIGLALSRKLARALGGELRLKSSKIEKGSVFQFSLPLKECPAEVLSIPQNQIISNTRKKNPQILLADDSENSRMLFELVFRKTNMNLTVVEDGKQAVDKIMENKNYDLIVMDLQMPVMDGYEATLKIREMGVKTPIIALTAHALSQFRDKCFESGFNDYITKPITPSSFLRKIQNYL
ncbi:MAG: response regulator [Bdellovibrionales bacterium]|nr:response regulator [Bdellovibrionales bacterium]